MKRVVTKPNKEQDLFKCDPSVPKTCPGHGMLEFKHGTKTKKPKDGWW